MTTLQIQQIIAEQKLLTVSQIVDYFAETFAVKVKHHEEHGLLLFMYDQIRTNFALRGASECRGIILRDTAPHETACVPFFKFFNIDERHAARIDWTTARVYEKLDGSIIKVYWHRNEWLVATNGTIDSRTTPVYYNAASDENTADDENDDNCEKLKKRVAQQRTFYDLFLDALPVTFDWSALDRDCTYMFELMHPQQLIVVEHLVPRLVHIGTRNNRTLVESYEPLPLLSAATTTAEAGADQSTKKTMMEQARSFSLATRDECIAAAAALGADQEGFVVVDAAWNRVKIKGPVYVALHHTAGNLSSISVDQCAVDIFLNGESEEVRAYRLGSQRLAGVSDAIDRIEKRFRAAIDTLCKTYDRVRKNVDAEALVNADRKKIAIDATALCGSNKIAFNFVMARATREITAAQRDSAGDVSAFEATMRDMFTKSAANRKLLLPFLADMAIMERRCFAADTTTTAVTTATAEEDTVKEKSAKVFECLG